MTTWPVVDYSIDVYGYIWGVPHFDTDISWSPHVQIPSPGYFVNMHNCARYGLQPQCFYVNQRYLGFLVSLIPDHILSASTNTKLQILWKTCLLPVSSELFYKSSLHTRHAKNRRLLLRIFKNKIMCTSFIVMLFSCWWAAELARNHKKPQTSLFTYNTKK